jgi:hypothetical protein
MMTLRRCGTKNETAGMSAKKQVIFSSENNIGCPNSTVTGCLHTRHEWHLVPRDRREPTLIARGSSKDALLTSVTTNTAIQRPIPLTLNYSLHPPCRDVVHQRWKEVRDGTGKRQRK